MLVRSDVDGHRPMAPFPGQLRSLTKRQRLALHAYPVVPATTRLIYQLSTYRPTLSHPGATLVGNVMRVAAEALEQVRAQARDLDVDTQLLLGVTALMAREYARDLIRWAHEQEGTVDAYVREPYDERLRAILRHDPLVAVAPSTDETYRNLGRDAVLIIGNLVFRQG